MELGFWWGLGFGLGLEFCMVGAGLMFGLKVGFGFGL